MNYTLCVLTHGRSEHLRRVLDSFQAHVVPPPTFVRVYVDGPDRHDAAYRAVVGRGWEWELSGGSPQQGFCRATAALWYDVAEGVGPWARETPYAFWLENDFVFTRDVDLHDLARVLDGDPLLAQMSLMRNAASDADRAAGGLYELRRDDYHCVAGGLDGDDHLRWLRHRSYFTTNPSLMRVEFMRTNVFSGESAECEGLFGLALLERGYSFGVWGEGEPWVEHVGAGRAGGFGY